MLVVTSLGRDSSAIAALLEGAGIQASILPHIRECCRQLLHSAGALLITEEALTLEEIPDLLDALRAQPSWSEMPVIILTNNGRSQLSGVVDRIAEAAHGVTLLERPIGTTTLLRAVQVALRSRERQYQVRDLLEEQEITRKFLLESQRQLRWSLAREKQLRRSAEESNRLKDEFLATMSHELRNPLNVIVGYSDLLLRDKQVNASPHLLQVSKVLRRNAMAQAVLIRDLLELSRLRSGKLTLNCEPVSLITAINNATETVRAEAARKGISIDIHVPQEPLVIEGDLLRLEQIFWNLLSNSVKFTPFGGRIQVRLSRRGPNAVVIVEDNGEGIAAEFLPPVFEMFRQGDAASNRRHSGMGIGLALVRQLVELHKGSVDAYSEGAGKGTRFVIQFPEQRLPPEIPGTVQDDSTRELIERTVLAVDDHRDTAEMIKSQLEARGATVFTATSGQEALQIARKRDVDIVLSDISMPDMDGFELLRKLRAIPGKEDLPVLALTGLGQPEDRRRALEEGFHAHLTKPLDMNTLSEILQQVSKK